MISIVQWIALDGLSSSKIVFSSCSTADRALIPVAEDSKLTVKSVYSLCSV